MKKLALLISAVLSASALAGYTYTYTTGMDFGDLTLNGSESIFVDGGGGHYLTLFDYTYANVQKTSFLISEGNGGIWLLGLASYSSLDLLGGQIHHLDLTSYAQAKLSGGQIDLLSSTQNATYIKHIEIVCLVGYVYNSTTRYLTGLWADGSAFNIKLVNVSGYSNTIDNIKFTVIPEPASLLLLAVGGMLLRHKRS